jgi:hypothetical protein
MVKAQLLQLMPTLYLLATLPVMPEAIMAAQFIWLMAQLWISPAAHQLYSLIQTQLQGMAGRFI